MLQRYRDSISVISQIIVARTTNNRYFNSIIPLYWTDYRVLPGKVTNLGIKVALSNLPALEVLDCDCSIVHALAELHSKYLENGQPVTPQYSLTALNYHQTSKEETPYIRRSLQLATSLCYSSVIKVIEIDIVRGLRDTDLLALMLLNSLRELTIAKSNRNNVCEITFDGGIVPVLKAVGGSLNLLKLHGLEMYMNLSAIDYFCPNLCHVFLENNLHYTLVQHPEEVSPIETQRPMFKKLETMHLHSSYETLPEWDHELEVYLQPLHVISPNIVLLLLSSPVLNYVSIGCCNNLSDDLLQQANNIHGFENLEQLELLSCKSLTDKGFDVFMNGNNPLKMITHGGCDLLTAEYLEECRKKIDNNNWKVKIEGCLSP